jgi:hypothetical protein
MTEQDKKGLAKALNDYIELKRSQAECTGFIDGFEKAIEYMNQGLLLPKHDVSNSGLKTCKKCGCFVFTADGKSCVECGHDC